MQWAAISMVELVRGIYPKNIPNKVQKRFEKYSPSYRADNLGHMGGRAGGQTNGRTDGIGLVQLILSTCMLTAGSIPWSSTGSSHFTECNQRWGMQLLFSWMVLFAMYQGCNRLTKASDAEPWCFLWSAPEQTVKQTLKTPVIWNAIAPIMTSL